MQKIAIVGFGVEGRGILKFLLKDPAHAKDEIWVLDRNPVSLPRSSRVRVKTGPYYLSALSSFDIIFKSPGVSIHFSQIQRAIKRGVRVTSSIDLFFERARGTVIGIAGTKGKGTTVTLLYQMLKRCGKDAYLGGNIGTSPLDFVNKLTPKSFTVLELSSFQLQNLHFSPKIAAVLDVFKDHLDVHKSVREYFSAESRIVLRQKKTDSVFYFTHNPISRRIAAKSKGKKFPVSEKDWKIFKERDLKIPGVHNFRNAVMAGMIAKYFGCSAPTIKYAAVKFRGLPYRIALEKTVRCGPHKIKIYNDSASTNPGATAAALRAFKEQKILIMGGKDKNLDYSPVAGAMQSARVRLVVIFGENKKKIARSLSSSRIPVVLASGLASALKAAAKHIALTTSDIVTTSDVVILFSPASASFDMFNSYKERGAEFTKLARTFSCRPARSSRGKL